MAFKAQLKKDFIDIHGLEEFIERKVQQVMKALGLSVGASKKAGAKKVKAATKKAVAAPVDALGQVLAALESHPKKAALVKAGKQKDQLLRSLIPLYVARAHSIEVSSGVTSKFWAGFGVKYAAPNAAKALREHVGYARRTKNGNQITPNGIKYVDAVLSGKKAA